MNKCLIISNQNIYDLMNINGLINYLSYEYDLIYLFVNYTIVNDANIIFKNISNIILVESNNFNKIDKKYSNCKIIKLGIYNEKCIKNLNINDSSINYFEYFYNQLNLNYDIKYKYEYLDRDMYGENKYFEKIKNFFKDGYIFYYNKNKDFIINDVKCIFNPIYNYYEDDSFNKNKWIDIKYNNIFDLLEIIENAEEIHLFDIDLYSVMPYLNLDNVKNKYIYHNNIMIKEYHKKLKDFRFIYYNK